MKEIANHDEREREPKHGEYCVPSCGTGMITCYVKGIVRTDFYRTGTVLIKDLKPLTTSEPTQSTTQ